MAYTYDRIPYSQVPEGVRFDVLGRDQGQTIEVAWGGTGRAEHGPGDPYKRVWDKSDGPMTDAALYFRRVF